MRVNGPPAQVLCQSGNSGTFVTAHQYCEWQRRPPAALHVLDRATSSSSLKPSSSLPASDHHLPSVKEIVDAHIKNASLGRGVVEGKVRRGPCVVMSGRASPTGLHSPLM